MKKHITICDKCGEEIDTENCTPHKIRITAKFDDMSDRYEYDICSKCYPNLVKSLKESLLTGDIL